MLQQRDFPRPIISYVLALLSATIGARFQKIHPGGHGRVVIQSIEPIVSRPTFPDTPQKDASEICATVTRM